MVRFLLPFFCIGLMGATCNDGASVKVWEFHPEDKALPLKGWYRDNGNEVKTFGESDVKYGINAADLEFILTRLRQCEEAPTPPNKDILDILLGNK